MAREKCRSAGVGSWDGPPRVVTEARSSLPGRSLLAPFRRSVAGQHFRASDHYDNRPSPRSATLWRRDAGAHAGLRIETVLVSVCERTVGAANPLILWSEHELWIHSARTGAVTSVIRSRY